MSKGNVRVALIDDDASMRRSLGNLLASHGFLVASYTSAEEFLEQRPDDIDCLVLDLKLPKMNGLELLELLRASQPDLSVILVTAHGDAETRRRALGLGAAAFLSKPFRAEELVAAVRHGRDDGR